MTQAERILASRLLKSAANELTYRGCNDMPKELLVDISPEGRQAMLAGYIEWDGNPDLDDLTFERVQDWMWMSYFAAKIKGDA
jgi:hypothetical protein